MRRARFTAASLIVVAAFAPAPSAAQQKEPEQRVLYVYNWGA